MLQFFSLLNKLVAEIGVKSKKMSKEKKLHVVLVEPEIPNNTGNIGRTCVALGASLHLVEPLGFSLDEKRLRRAGLDYWPYLDFKVHPNLNSVLEEIPPTAKKALFTTKAKKSHFEAGFKDHEAWLFFGKETKGLSEGFLAEHPEDLYKIPMPGETRSLNLANSVAIGLYEAFRQLNF